ncbi:hypothetical protein FQA39_LY11175 [Lamprigera yunnana]|nr:hypothetical protein FQA39_LY11175 [Lamprigera yunnana]
MKSLNHLLDDHLKSNNIYEDDPCWVIRQSKLSGRGLFAKRDINAGEVIFKDNTLIIGPRSSMLCPTVCVNCYKQVDLRFCSKNCGLPVCSEECESSSVHTQECQRIVFWKNEKEDHDFGETISKCLTPIRCLFLNENQKTLLKCLKSHEGDHHGFEVDLLKKKFMLNFRDEEEELMRLTCRILDANSFEVSVGNEQSRCGLRGLYPLSSLMNHSCIPNTMHNFNNQQTMIVKATVFIREGEEIFHSYTRLTWGTAVRRGHLVRTKHFFCQCRRCEDPTEFDTNLSGVLCEKCGDVVLPFYNGMDIFWRCVVCDNKMSTKKVNGMLRILGSRINSFNNADVEDMLSFLKKKIPNYLPQHNQISIELKYKLVWILGYDPKYLWTVNNIPLDELYTFFCGTLTQFSPEGLKVKIELL